MLERGFFQVAALALQLVAFTAAASVEAARLHDPTRPETASAKPTAFDRSTPQLEMILSGVTRKLAVINGQELAVGDRGEGFVVQKIEPDAVLIEMTGRASARSLMRLRLNRMAKELHP